MNPFEYIRERITEIADVNAAVDGRYPDWGYLDLMGLLLYVEESYNAKYGSSDVIYRSDAIGEIENYPHGCTWNVESMKDMTDRIKALPSAQPDYTHMVVGNSKNGITMWYECAKCNEPVTIGDKYCRNCGREFRNE